MKKDLRDYLDCESLVVQKAGDGGDSLNRTCAVFALERLAGNVRTAMGPVIWNLQSRHVPGRFRRSWHPGKWYADFNRTSRDQLIPLLVALGLSKEWNAELWKVLWEHKNRLFMFAYNTRRNFQYPTLEEHLEKSTPDVEWDYERKTPDFTGPEFWALYIRGLKLYFLWPLLFILDLETLFASIVLRFHPDKEDVINHALILEYSKVRMPTIPSLIAKLINPRSFLQPRLDAFFSKEIEPPLNELYKQIV